MGLYKGLCSNSTLPFSHKDSSPGAVMCLRISTWAVRLIQPSFDPPCSGNLLFPCGLSDPFHGLPHLALLALSTPPTLGSPIPATNLGIWGDLISLEIRMTKETKIARQVTNIAELSEYNNLLLLELKRCLTNYNRKKWRLAIDYR